MRVLQVIDTVGPGGAEDVFVSMAGALHAMEDTTCVAMIPGPGWIASILASQAIPTEFAPFAGTLNVPYLRAIVKAIRTHRIEIIHSHLLGASLYSTIAGQIAGVPVIATFHGAFDVRPGVRFVAAKGRVLRRAQRIVAVSTKLKEFLVPRLGLDAARVDVIENGIEISRFLDAEPLDLRSVHRIPAGAYVIGSVGNIRPAKDYPAGLNALAALRAGGVDAHWVIAGQPDSDGELQAALRSQASALGLRDVVHFAGFVEHPERFYAALDCYLLCSSSEGHPLALCQAMTTGLPVVATRCGAEAFARGGIDGWLVPVGDHEAMAAALREALLGREEAERRAANARAHAISAFDIAGVRARYLALYQAALSRPR